MTDISTDYKVEVYNNKGNPEFFIVKPIDKALEKIIYDKCIIPYMINGKPKDRIFNRLFKFEFKLIEYHIDVHYH
jgi:hypothetical protein